MGDYNAGLPIERGGYSTDNIFRRLQKPQGLEIAQELIKQDIHQLDDARFKLRDKDIKPIEEDHVTEAVSGSFPSSPESARQEISEDTVPVDFPFEEDGYIDAEAFMKYFKTLQPKDYVEADNVYNSQGSSLEQTPVKDRDMGRDVDDAIDRWQSATGRSTEAQGIMKISKEEMKDARRVAERRIKFQRSARNEMIEGIGKERVKHLDDLARNGSFDEIEKWEDRTELENAYLIQLLMKNSIPFSYSVTHNNESLQLYELHKLAENYPQLAQYIGYDGESLSFQTIEKLFGSQITMINVTQGDWTNNSHGHHEGNKPSIQSNPGDLVINVTLNDSERLVLKGMDFDEGFIHAIYDMVTYEEHDRVQASEHDPAVKLEEAPKTRNLAVITPENRGKFFEHVSKVRFSIPLFGAPEDIYLPRVKRVMTPPKG